MFLVIKVTDGLLAAVDSFGTEDAAAQKYEAECSSLHLAASLEKTGAGKRYRVNSQKDAVHLIDMNAEPVSKAI